MWKDLLGLKEIKGHLDHLGLLAMQVLLVQMEHLDLREALDHQVRT